MSKKFTFFCSTGFTIGCLTKLTIRNSPDRTCYKKPHNRNNYSGKDVEFGINIFDNGNIVYKKDNYGVVKYHDYFNLSINDIPYSFDHSKEYLLQVVSCEGSMYAENVLSYHIGDKFCNVIYGCSALPENNDKYGKIVLLNYKCWVNKDIDAFILISNIAKYEQQTLNTEPIEILVLSENGNVIYTHKAKIYFNSSYIFSVKEHLQDFMKFSEDMSFFNVVAKMNNALYSIATLIKNQKSANMAIEHSLAPYYYLETKKMSIIRESALSNFLTNANN